MYTATVSPSDQLRFFVISLAFGFAMGVVYELFRLIRLISPRSRLLCFVCDVMFMSLASLLSFVLTVVINLGIVRWYILLGEVVGFFVYMRTVGRVSGAVFRLVRWLITKLLWIVFTPLRLLWHLMVKFLSKIAKKIKKFIKSLLKNRKRILYNDLE